MAGDTSDEQAGTVDAVTRLRAFGVPPGFSIAVLIGAAYAVGIQNTWVNWDDNAYIPENPDVVQTDGIARIWTRFDRNEYYPATFTSYWLEYRLWGDRPGGYYVTNVVLHAINSVLVYRLALALGAGVAGAWLAGCVFGLHPLQVASVAWLAERKNVLSTAFGLWSFLLYLRWVGGTAARGSKEERGRIGRFPAGSVALFALSLLSKTAGVILPISMFLAARLMLGVRDRRAWLGVVPMLVLAAAAGVVTLAMERGVFVAELDWPARAAVAGAIPWFYVTKFLAPYPLAPVYPAWPQTAGEPLYWLGWAGLAVAGWGLWRWRKRSGPLTLWCAAHAGIALLPVSGLLRFDYLRMTPVADHFAYLAMVGLGIGAGHWIERLLGGVRVGIPEDGGSAGELSGESAGARRAKAGPAMYSVLGVIVLLMIVLTARQVGVWRDGVTTWSYTLKHNPKLAVAHNNLGASLAKGGRDAEAVEAYRRALELDPSHGLARQNMGIALRNLGRLEEAADAFEEARRLFPKNAVLAFNLGYTLAQQGRLDEAVALYREALALNPGYSEARTNLGIALRMRGGEAESIEELRKAVAQNPEDALAHFNLGVSYADAGRLDEAIRHYRQAIRLTSRNSAAWTNLGIALLKQGDPREAYRCFEEALRINPEDALAHLNMGGLEAQRGQAAEAERHFREAVRLNPSSAQAQNNLGALLAQQGRCGDATAYLNEAVRLNPQHANARFLLGLCLASTGAPEKAIEHLRAALELQPRDSEAAYRLGLALEATGQPEAAAEAFRKALEIAPEMREASEALRRLTEK